jgi:hypothetical protein
LHPAVCSGSARCFKDKAEPAAGPKAARVLVHACNMHPDLKVLLLAEVNQ